MLALEWSQQDVRGNNKILFDKKKIFFSSIQTGSNHYGIAGWYTLRAINQGMIGLSGTNTSPLMSPTRSMEAGIGTNPISFAAPAENGDSFVLDMATTAVAVGKIEIQRRKGLPIPHGWAHDTKGNLTTDAEVAFSSGCLAPLGGSELTSGYKGYGLGAMIDILGGVLSGGLYSNKIRKWTHVGSDAEADLGQFFIAVIFLKILTFKKINYFSFLD